MIICLIKYLQLHVKKENWLNNELIFGHVKCQKYCQIVRFGHVKCQKLLSNRQVLENSSLVVRFSFKLLQRKITPADETPSKN